MYDGKYMSEGEILTSYRQAKDKKEQLHILADLNLCSVSDIREVLKKNGVDGRTLPSGSVIDRPTDQTESKPVAKRPYHRKQRAVPTPVMSAQNVLDYIKQLSQKKRELMAQVQEIDKELRNIACLCNQIKDGDL